MAEFERLKALLLDAEREQLGAHERRLHQAEQRQHELPQVLPQLLERAQSEAGEGRLASALAKPIAQSLVTIVREQRQTVVDALFPVIGPAIRKAIAEYLRNFVDGMNRALEASLTPRGLRWRLESWRTGSTYAAVVLRHTLRFKLDHLFLIERESGLVLHRRSALDLPDLDSDAIAGMLTAIGEFVKDSVGRDSGEGLESARVGEHLLWLLEGPRASFAAFIRGVPSEALRAALQLRLERIHERFGDPLAPLQAGAAEWGPLLDQELELDTIEREGREDGAAAAPIARSRLPFRLAMAVLALLLLGWLVRGWWWAQRMETLRGAFAAWPGLVVERIDSRPFRSVHVRGLLDALAEAPDALAAQPPWKDYRFEFELRGFVSADPAIVERRARALLDPPASVRVAVHGGRLALSGTASAEWIAQARERAAFVPGVSGADLGALVPAGASEREQQLANLAALVEKLQAGEVTFVDELDSSPDGRAVLARMGGELRSAQELARLLGKNLRVHAIGLTDEVGTDPYNEALRGRRARWLATQLAGMVEGIEVAPATAAEAQASVTLRRRAARLTIALQDSAAP